VQEKNLAAYEKTLQDVPIAFNQTYFIQSLTRFGMSQIKFKIFELMKTFADNFADFHAVSGFWRLLPNFAN
jgi:hypothetical protein